MAKANVFVLAAAVWIFLQIQTKDSTKVSRVFAVPKAPVNRGNTETDSEDADTEDEAEDETDSETNFSDGDWRSQAAGRLYKIAEEHYRKEEYQQSVDVLQEAYDTHGPSNTSVFAADILDAWADIYWNKMGSSLKAVPLAEEALNIRKEVLGNQSLDVVSSIDWLADLYTNVGELSLALQLYNESLNIVRAALGTEDEDLEDYQASLDNLADTYVEMGDLANAVPLYEESTESRRKALGDWSPIYAASLDALGDVYFEMGSLSQVVPLFTQSLGIVKQAYGTRSTHYATSLDKVGDLYFEMGLLQQALPFYEEVLELRKELQGANTSEYIDALENLAELHEEMGEPSKAVACYEEALGVRKELYGSDSPDYATCLDRVAKLCSETGNLGKALPLTQESFQLRRARYEEVVKSRREVLGHHIDQVDEDVSLDNLAALTDHLVETEALPFYEESLRFMESELGLQHPEYANSLHELASFYERLGNFEWAFPLYEESRRIQEELACDSEHKVVYPANLEKLESLYHDLGAIEVSNVRPLLDPLRSASLNNCATVWREKGNYTEAEHFSTESLRIRREVLKSKIRKEVMSTKLAAGVAAE